MARNSLLIAAGLAAALAAAWGYGSPATAQPYGDGWGMMGGHGPGMMRGYGPNGGCPGYGGFGDYGPGSMHSGRGYDPGYGRGWMRGPDYGREWSGRPDDLKLTTDDVKVRVERWLARRGNPRLKLGDVKEKDADTIVADVVTKDNSLVERFVVNRHTGYFERDGD